MYLSNNELRQALESRELIVDPLPSVIDPTSIDLRLDDPAEARVWDITALNRRRTNEGEQANALRIGRFNYRDFSAEYLIPPPADDSADVYRRGDDIVIKPGGFLLWQTLEIVGTPRANPKYIIFIDGKSTRARTGLLIHLTAPTIHAGWKGKVTLEIANLGPFHFVLSAGDVIAQIVVACITSSPDFSEGAFGQTSDQRAVTGRPD